MKKSIFVVLLLVLMTVSFTIAGCGSDKTTGTNTSTNSGSAAENKENVKVIELKFNDWAPQATDLSQLQLKAFKMIEEKSNGRVKITPYFDQTLIGMADTFKGVAGGLADISKYTVGTTPGVQDINYIFNLPVIGLPNMQKTLGIYQELLKKYPELQQENEKKGVRWLSIAPMPPNQLHLTKSLVKVPKDLKGKSIITAVAMYHDLLKASGGAGLKLGPPDWYTSMQKGIGEGQMVHYPATLIYKTLELEKYHTHIGDGGLGMSGIGYIINLNTWNSLPQDIQQIIVEAFDWVNAESIGMNEKLINDAINQGKQAGHTFHESTPEELKAWAEAFAPINEKWVQDTEAKGWPARKIYDGLQQMIKDTK